MSEEKTCLRCGGANLKSGAFQSTGKVYFRPDDFKPRALFTTGVRIDAVACFECGHLELVVNADKASSLSKVS